jgi:hypothetical protein
MDPAAGVPLPAFVQGCLRSGELVSWLRYYEDCVDAADAADATRVVGGSVGTNGVVLTEAEHAHTRSSDVCRAVLVEGGQVRCPGWHPRALRAPRIAPSQWWWLLLWLLLWWWW